MRAAAVCESSSSDSAVLSQCSTTEEQTLSPHSPPPLCKSAAVYPIQPSALTFSSCFFLFKVVTRYFGLKRLHVNNSPFPTNLLHLFPSALLCCHLLASRPDCKLLFQMFIYNWVSFPIFTAWFTSCRIYKKKKVKYKVIRLLSFAKYNFITGMTVPACSSSSAGGC